MAKIKASLKKIAIILACFSVPYVGSYAYLSEHGQYEVAGYSFGGLIWLSWAPEGFYRNPDEMRFNTVLMIAYLPLVVLDYRLWHPGITAGDKTTYPVDQDGVNRCARMIDEINRYLSQKSN